MTVAASTPRVPLLHRSPLGGRYGAAVVLALLALCPFIVLTTAFALVQDDVIRELGTTKLGTQISAGLANAAYAFGAVVAAGIVQRIPSRWVFLACEVGFIAGTLLALFAGEIVMFTAGRTLQGLATGMLLVAALPPLVIGHGPERLPTTAAVINLGLFGMVTLGPVVGGIAAGGDGFRVLLAIVAVAGVAGLIAGALGFELTEPMGGDDPPRFDRAAIPLALGATVLPFLGVASLANGSPGSPFFFVPALVGLGSVVALIVVEYHREHALMPVRPISHTLPVAGIIAAMVAGAAFTTLLELTEIVLLQGGGGRAPATIGALLAAQLIGVTIAALAFRAVLRTRHVPTLALSGLLTVAVAAVLLLVVPPTSAGGALVPVVALLLGFGAGAGVAPGLFMAGLSVPSSQIGPTFALVELLRSEAAFLVGPILIFVATSATAIVAGFQIAVAATLAFTLIGGALAVAVYMLGGARLHRPDLQAWLDGEHPAFQSPTLFARVRDD